MQVSSIADINQLPENEKRSIYMRLIPQELLKQFKLGGDLRGPKGEDLYVVTGAPNSNSVKLALYHQPGFPDPITYAHLIDTVDGKIHVLLYVMNDPASSRFNVDVLPDGSATHFGAAARNLEAETASLAAGRWPGQVRQGLGRLRDALASFENFVRNLGHDHYFIQPLYYHNAIIFENLGFSYQSGRKLMQRIHASFAAGGELRAKLDSSTPFRAPQAADSVRLRSWAIHDGVLGERFTNVTMYRVLEQPASENSAPGVAW